MNENFEMKDEELRKAISSEPVPEELSPENIKKMLDEKGIEKKRRNIKKTALRLTAGAAACAVICGAGVYAVGHGNNIFNRYDFKSYEGISGKYENSSYVVSKENETAVNANSYMNSISDYGDIYSMFEKAYEKYNERLDESDYADGALYEENESVSEDKVSAMGGEDDYSETYNQEEGVLEADISKTDGKYIYYLYSKFIESESACRQYINIAETKDGNFVNSQAVDISNDFKKSEKEKCDTNIILHDMYLYNDMLIVINEVQIYDYSENEIDENGYICGIVDCERDTYVNVYTTCMEPHLVDRYCQDGGYSDVRISPDGYLYLITNDSSDKFSQIDDEEDIEAYIPSYVSDEAKCLIAPEDILIPDDEIDECSSISYTIIGGLDLNESGSVSNVDVKAIAGYTGYVYCSSENLYIASGWKETSITRIALDEGVITPAASGKVKGYLDDQFSMSEYNGYFRIATTFEDWHENIFDEFFSWERESINNYVYVLDLDLNVVGSVSDFGINETIKSVNFNGDMAYVVTYEQTDPLFAIDLSNPQEPTILDEFKILGYSSYMQKWSDSLLLGFGINADENGVQNGVKLVMFDNSDPNNLAEVGTYIIDNSDENTWIRSEAIWNRKALLIAPEKNIIGLPVTENRWSMEEDDSYLTTKFMFFSYENGQFSPIGEISDTLVNYVDEAGFRRAVYIGDYVYVLSCNKFVSADIGSFSEKKTVEFQ